MKNPLMHHQVEPWKGYHKDQSGVRRGILTRISAVASPVDPKNKGLRTETVDGQFKRLPTPGKRFVMISEPLEYPNADMRFVETSKVEKIVDKDFQPDMATYTFETQNTVYQLRIPR